MDVPLEMILYIWNILMQMYQAKVHVTLDTMLGKLKERLETRQLGWKWSRSTLYKLLTSKINFIYTDRKSHYEALHEDVTIAEQRTYQKSKSILK